MPKLPDRTALGSPGSFRSGRNRPTLGLNSLNTTSEISARAMAGGAANLGHIGRGLKSLGNVGMNIAEDEARQRDGLELAAAEAEKTKAAYAQARTFDNDPDHASYGMRFDVGTAAINEGAASRISNPELRKRWLLKEQGQDEGRKHSLLSKADALAREEKHVALDGILKQHQNIYIAEPNSPEMRDQQLGAIDEAIEVNVRTGLLTPKEAAALREKYLAGTQKIDAAARLDRGDDGLLPELEGTRTTKPVTFGDDGVAVGDDGKPIKGLTRAGDGVDEDGLQYLRHKEDLKLQAYSDGRQTSIGYGTKAKPGETSITKEEAERRLREETGKVSSWIKGNITVPLTQRQHNALVSFGYNLGTDDLEKLKGDINAGNFEKAAGRMLSFNRFENQPNAGLTRRRQEEAEMFLGSGPSHRYAAIDPETRAKLIDGARRAKKTRDEGRLWEMKQQIADDVKSLEETGYGREDLDLEGIHRTVEPSVWGKYMLDRREAAMTYNAGRDIEQMDGDQLRRHVGDLLPGRGEEDYEIKLKIWDKMKKRRDDIIELREKDPAEAVGKSYEVQAVIKRQQENGGVQNPAELAQARLEAQARLGINADNRRAVSLREAKALLDLPSERWTIDGGVYRNKLVAAAERINKEYGPIQGPTVFKHAVALDLKDATGQEASKEMAAKIALGQRITIDDYQRMRELSEIDMAGGIFGISEYAPRPGRPLTPEAQMMDPTMSAAKAGMAEPNPAHVQFILDHAGDAAAMAEVDRKFGHGTVASVLAASEVKRAR